MKKLVIGIAVVALLALMAVPAMADIETLDTAEVYVTIEVLEYGAIEFNPDATMSFPVPGPYVPGADYGDTKDFSVRCNVACTLTVEADTVSSSSAVVVPGQIGEAGDPYPTATGISGPAATGGLEGGPHYIGFGLAAGNLGTPPLVGWGTGDDFAKVVVDFDPTLTGDPDPNARITLNSYMCSSRDGDLLAPPGVYDATLTLTLSTAA